MPALLLCVCSFLLHYGEIYGKLLFMIVTG
jgi:hypothetical protein